MFQHTCFSFEHMCFSCSNAFWSKVLIVLRMRVEHKCCSCSKHVFDGPGFIVEHVFSFFNMFFFIFEHAFDGPGNAF